MTDKISLKDAFGVGSEQDAQRLSRERAQDFAQEIREIEEAQARGEAVPDYKFLGIIKVPPIVGAGLKTLFLPFVYNASGFVRDNANQVASQLIPKVLSDAKHQNIAIRSTSLALGIGTLLAENGMHAWNNVSTYKKNIFSAAADIAPVLDEIKGGHGFTSFLSVTSDENEVIYAHRQKISAAHSQSHLSNLVGMVDKLPKLIHFALDEITHHKIILPEKLSKASELVSSKADWAGATMGPFADLYRGSIDKDYKRANAKPSALTMITALAEQLKQDAEGADLEIPGAKNRQVSLTDYIALTFKRHQEHMAEIDPGYSAIRSKLDDKLHEISEHLADAIKKGEINPLMLVRLVGERQIIKNGGRALTDIKHVDSLIHKLSGKTQSYTHIPEKEFFADVNKEDIKMALNTLKGKEREMFMATLPDNILEAAGVAPAEIKNMRDATSHNYRQMLAQSVMGLAENDNKTLEAMDLAQPDTEKLLNAQKEISAHGVDAIDKLRTSASNNDGIERVIHQAVINRVRAGDAHLLGRISEQGKQAIVAAAANENRADESDMEANADASEENSHAEKVRSGRQSAAKLARHS